MNHLICTSHRNLLHRVSLVWKITPIPLVSLGSMHYSVCIISQVFTCSTLTCQRLPVSVTLLTVHLSHDCLVWCVQIDNLQDSAGQRPSYNLRTLCRALEYTAAASSSYGLDRALYDGFSMSFLTQLNTGSAQSMQAILAKHLLSNTRPKDLKVRILFKVIQVLLATTYSCCQHKQ